MPIEFRCPECNVLLRTADGTEGRPVHCPECGANATVPAPRSIGPRARRGPPRPVVEETGWENHAIYGMILSACSIGLCCCLPVGLVCALAGIVLSILGLRSARSRLAVAGILLGLLGGVIGLVTFVFGVVPWIMSVGM